MKTIKAFQKDKKGYYLQCNGNKYYFEINQIYQMDEMSKNCRNCFSASAHFDISETVRDYPLYDDIYYGIVYINFIEIEDDKIIGNKIKVLEFLPNEFDILVQYDRTGRWIYFAGVDWKQFDYEKGCEKLLEIDKTGEWIYWAGSNWKQFDYKNGLRRLLEIDKTGEWIYWAGRYWKQFDYEKGFEKLLEIDKTGKWIFVAGKYWK